MGSISVYIENTDLWTDATKLEGNKAKMDMGGHFCLATGHQWPFKQIIVFRIVNYFNIQFEEVKRCAKLLYKVYLYVYTSMNRLCSCDNHSYPNLEFIKLLLFTTVSNKAHYVCVYIMHLATQVNMYFWFKS